MEFLFTLLPFVISFILGHLLIDFWGRKETHAPDLFLRIPLAVGLGLGISSYIGFFSFVLWDKFQRATIILLHLLFLVGLLWGKSFLVAKKQRRVSSVTSSMPLYLFFMIIFVSAVPLWIEANHYPWGGWDAWSCWNLKTKFLFLGGNHWKNVFSPILWRASPHYPLLLPLLNLWSWIFLDHPNNLGPMIVTVLFTLLNIGLLFSGLKYLTKNNSSLLAGFLMFSSPFYTTLAISQYCDIVLSYFLLAGLCCFTLALHERRESFFILAGLFTGFLSFTKPEGMIAAVLLLMLGTGILGWEKRNLARRELGLFLGSAVMAFLPTIVFKFLYSPGNQTFINGLFSKTKPINLFRIQFTMAFFMAELMAAKWNGLWAVLSAGLIFSGRKCFEKRIRIFPLFLFFYLGIIIFYYWLNTYFEIRWWLQVTLNRILFSLIPAFIFWIFYSLWQRDTVVSMDENKTEEKIGRKKSSAPARKTKKTG